MIPLITWWRQRRRNRQLALAVEACDAVRARRLLKEGASPSGGKTPLLHLSLEHGDLFLFRLLVQHDAPLGARNGNGQTVYEAVQSMPRPFQRALMERTAPPWLVAHARRHGWLENPGDPSWPAGPGTA